MVLKVRETKEFAGGKPWLPEALCRRLRQFAPLFCSLPVLPGGFPAQHLRPGDGAVQLPAQGDGAALRELRAGRLRIPALRR